MDKSKAGEIEITPEMIEAGQGKEAAKRRDEALKRALNTPPKPRKKQPKRPNGQKK